MKDVAIAGIGTIGFGKSPDLSASAMANRAFKAALGDCGLAREDVDGLVCHIGSPRGLDYDEIAALLGLDLRYASQTWAHGRFCGTVLQTAAMAIANGLAETVACVGVFRNTAFSRPGTKGFPGFDENFREGGGPHAETPHTGMIAPIGGAAMSFQRYLYEHDKTAEGLAAVALSQRAHASLNPLAYKQDPLSEDDYAAAPYICEPLRRLDCSVPVDTGVVVLLTSLKRAEKLAQPPVRLSAFQGLSGGPNEFVFGRPGLGIHQRDRFAGTSLGADEPVFAKSNLGPGDIDTLHCYDGFAPQVIWTLERFGFAPVGQALDWIQGGRIGPGGELPVNTSGGHLSEGHSNGWGQTVEIVRQLRGTAGARQVPNCRNALWATTFGDAILYEN
ncbi:MAG: thiolase family protein [Marinosulfonomonas sp.]|nr:thiolase family protein [Marinosulfonomonas sp.]